ncbi:MAG: hypothetical protein Q9214_004314, partial [Letrouitia sp. 1 TL-2023]
GVAVAKKDFNLPKHDQIGVKNLYVIKACQSLTSRGYLKTQFSWQFYYYTLTPEGLDYLREWLHLPAEVVPQTHVKQQRSHAPPRGMLGGDDRDRRGGGRGGGGRGEYRRRDQGEKETGAPGEFNPGFRGGFERQVMASSRSTSPSFASTNLWDKAVESLNEEDKRNVDFEWQDKRAILVALSEVQRKKELCISKRLKYRRKNGECVILYDVFEKMVKWIDTFKQIGDVAMQYDPGYAALPWAGVRFFLQVAINDVQIFGALVEGLQVVSEIISRYAAFESLYLQRSSSVKGQLRNSIIATYASILFFFSCCRKNFGLGLGRRLARNITHNAENVVIDQLNKISRNDESVLKLTQIVDAERSQTMEARQASTSTEIGDLNTGVKALRSDSTESMLKLESLLKSIQDPLIRGMVQTSVLSESVVGSADKQERQDILHWLSNVQDASLYKMEAVKRVISIVASWHPSTVIQRFIDETSTQSNTAPTAYFYCRRSSAEPQRSDPTDILRAILKQLMCCDPKWQTGSTVAKEYKSRKQEAEKDGSDIAYLDIDETTQKIVDITAKTSATIFIDALDECSPEERYRLLRALDILLDESVHLVKVFVSSRDDMDIVIKLQQHPNIYINIKDNKMDIDKFAQVEIEKAIKSGRLLNGQVSAELQNYVITSLQRKANGMYVSPCVQMNV